MFPENVSRAVRLSPDPISDPERLAAVGEILPGQSRDPEFDRLTGLAASLLKVPTCMISLVTAETQEFKGASGLPSLVANTRSTPLSHSFCKHTVSTGRILKVEDAPSDPRVSGNPAIEGIGLRSYLGFPLVNSAGHVLGSFCLIDYVPRKWTEGEIDTVRDFAGLAMDLIESVARESRTAAALDVIVHDLRSPLSGISLSSAVLKERIDLIPQQLHGFVGNIVVSTENAVKLLDTFTELDHGHGENFCEDPCGVLDAVVAKFQPLADEKGMAIVSSKEDPIALAVPQRVLEQALENLVSNALKYAPPGTSVWLSFESDGKYGWFHVRDEGPGFSTKDRQRMFQRYSRLSAKPTGNEDSTGIGLSIVKRLTIQNGGTLELVSPPGTGAEFRLGFPVL